MAEMTNDGQRNCLEWLQSQPDTEELLRDLPTLEKLAELKLEGEGGAVVQGWELLPPEAQEELRKIQAANKYLYELAAGMVRERLQPRDSGQNFINDSPVVKELIKRITPQAQRSKSEIVLGTNTETGEPAIFTLLGGYITPYEKEVIECVSKFKLDGQLTEKGRVWFTLGQLYRAMRHGAGTARPTPEQKQALLQCLIKLSNDDRKLTFKLNEYLKVWGGFETNGGRLRIIGFDELFGKIRGQEDILILLDDTPVICAVAENLQMWEPIAQEVKAIQQRRYTLELKEPIQIGGKPAKKRSFATNEERVKFCKKYGITSADIESYSDSVKPWALSDNRIALRSVILSFVYSYIRARAAGKPHSNKLPYSAIFERCEVDTNSPETVKRAKNDIGVIMNHLTACQHIKELKSWGEYTNKGSKKPDGIEISLKLPEIEG